MPKEVENKLKKEAKEKFGSTTSERARKYIYGTMQNIQKKSIRREALKGLGKK
jgi:hypothetical protein